jgi:hypothetical protein
MEPGAGITSNLWGTAIALIVAVAAAMLVGTPIYISVAGYGPNGVVHITAVSVALFAVISTVLGLRRYSLTRLTPVRFVLSFVVGIATYFALAMLATPRDSETTWQPGGPHNPPTVNPVPPQRR